MKKVYVLLIIMVLSLMTAGYSYAYWTDTLTVSGTVQTGESSVVWVHTGEGNHRGLIERPGDINHPNFDELSVREFNDGDKIIYMDFINLHPSSNSRVGSWYKNVGTIPAKINNIRLKVVTPQGGFTTYQRNLLDSMDVRIRVLLEDHSAIGTNPNRSSKLWKTELIDDNETYYFVSDYPGWGDDSRELGIGEAQYLMVIVHVNNPSGYDCNEEQDTTITFELELSLNHWNME